MRILLSSLAAVTVAAFANANAGSKVYICPVPQPNELDQAGYEALPWVEVKGIGSHGETGSTTNILTYDTWDTKVALKAKGIINAGDPEIECARLPDDPGQKLMSAGAKGNFNWAFKMERNDKPTETGTPTILYNRGLLTGPRHPWGRNEDFDLAVYQCALQQEEIVVDASLGGNGPVNTVLPAVTGVAQVGEILTATPGTWTGDATITYAYQWLANNVTISSATEDEYTATAAELGKVLSCRVTATNDVSSAFATSAPTVAVIAA